MKEHNRLKLQRLSARYAQRKASEQADKDAESLSAFEELCNTVIAPLMEEVAAELRKAGHRPRIVRDDSDPQEPAIELELGLRHDADTRNAVGFRVIRWTGCPLQFLAYLEARRPPPFDLARFSHIAEMRAELIEQLLIQGVEHVIMCNAP